MVQYSHYREWSRVLASEPACVVIRETIHPIWGTGGDVTHHRGALATSHKGIVTGERDGRVAAIRRATVQLQLAKGLKR